MRLFFEIREGDRQGARFEIKPGLSIGRRTADIQLRDSKVSSRHAIIESRENDSLYLVDNQSANGVKVAGRRVPEVALTPGSEVQIGRTFLVVIDLEDEAGDSDAPIIETWTDTLDRLMTAAKEKLKSEPRDIAALNPIVTLKFLQGPQTGTVWTLGYGPRQIGAASIDLQLHEPKTPDICFEIVPRRTGPIFRTSHPGLVRLNGKEYREEPLSNGDVVEVQKVRIQILLSEE